MGGVSISILKRRSLCVSPWLTKKQADASVPPSTRAHATRERGTHCTVHRLSRAVDGCSPRRRSAAEMARAVAGTG